MYRFTTKPPLTLRSWRGPFVVAGDYPHEMPETHDRGSGPYQDGKPVTRESLHQEVLNSSWPQRDKNGTHARDIRPAQHADGTPWTIDVIVRLELSDDGWVEVDGRAERWNSAFVFVAGIDDPRVPWGQVWVRATDVKRR